MKFSARDYRMPRYKEIPNVGLYLEQTVKYINECLAPIEISITPSMLSKEGIYWPAGKKAVLCRSNSICDLYCDYKAGSFHG